MLTPVEVEIRNELIMARSIPRISTRVQKVMRMSAALTAIRRNDIDKIPDVGVGRGGKSWTKPLLTASNPTRFQKYKRKAGIDGELRASKKSRLDVAEVCLPQQLACRNARLSHCHSIIHFPKTQASGGTS